MNIENIFKEELTLEEEIITLFIKYKNEPNEANKLKILKKIKEKRESQIKNESTKRN